MTEDRARWAREAEERTHNDWARLARYREENPELADSITGGLRSMVA